MPKHLERDMESLKRRLLDLGGMVEAATNKAIRALVERRLDLAQEVMQGDDEIDRQEVQIEEECLKMLALHQPVANQLRFIIGVLKVNNDLERMGDLCVNIAERASKLAAHPPLEIELDFPRMAQGVRTMVRDSLKALIHQDADLARRVCRQDDEIDALNREMFHVLQKAMRKDPSTVKRAVHLLSVSRHLERMADLSTNVAEDVVFIAEGEMIRHQAEV